MSRKKKEKSDRVKNVELMEKKLPEIIRVCDDSELRAKEKNLQQSLQSFESSSIQEDNKNARITLLESSKLLGHLTIDLEDSELKRKDDEDLEKEEFSSDSEQFEEKVPKKKKRKVIDSDKKSEKPFEILPWGEDEDEAVVKQPQSMLSILTDISKIAKKPNVFNFKLSRKITAAGELKETKTNPFDELL